MTLGPAYGDGFAGVSNPVDNLYVRGDETTDLSIRFVPESAASLAAVLEARNNGVWNKGELIVDANTLKLGEASVSAAFAYLEVEAPGELAALMPHIEFDNDGTRLVHTPVLDELKEFEVAVFKDGEVSGTVITESITASFSNIIETLIHEVGSVGATSQVSYTVYHGTDNTGSVKFQRNFPASDFSAGAFLFIPTNRALGVEKDESIFVEIASDVSFSMAVDNVGHLITVIDAYPLAELGIYTENIMLDESLNTIFDESLNPMYENQF